MRRLGGVVGPVPRWASARNAAEKRLDRRYAAEILAAARRGRALGRRLGPMISGDRPEFLVGPDVEIEALGRVRLESAPPDGPIQRDGLYCLSRPRAVLIGVPPHWRMQDPSSGRSTRLKLLEGAVVRFDQNTFVGAGTYLTVGDRGRFAMGVSSYVGHDCNINCIAGISIGRDCLVGQQTSMMDYDGHPVFRVGSRSSGPMVGGTARPITVGDRVWIGFRATILKGVQIGDGSIIGAGSVVGSSIPSNCIAAGNPARVIRRGVTWRRF